MGNSRYNSPRRYDIDPSTIQNNTSQQTQHELAEPSASYNGAVLGTATHPLKHESLHSFQAQLNAFDWQIPPIAVLNPIPPTPPSQESTSPPKPAYLSAHTSQSTPAPSMENQPTSSSPTREHQTVSGAGVAREQPTIESICDEHHFFNLDPYLRTCVEATGLPHHDGDHVWICGLGLDSSKHVPSIPEAYEQEAYSHRAIYVLGVPDNWNRPQFEEIFRAFGTIENCPSIIDITSEETFRWVVMSNKVEAERVQKRVHRLKFQDFKLVATTALPPGRGLCIAAHRALVDKSYTMPADPVFPIPAGGFGTVHGHPKPPTNAQLISPVDNEGSSPLDILPRACEGYEDPVVEPATVLKRPADPAITPENIVNTITTPLLLEPLSYGAGVSSGKRQHKPIPPRLVFKEDDVVDPYPEPQHNADPNNNPLRDALASHPSQQVELPITPEDDLRAILSTAAFGSCRGASAMTDNPFGEVLSKQSTAAAEADSPTPNPLAAFLVKNQAGSSKAEVDPPIALLRKNPFDTGKSEAALSMNSLAGSLPESPVGPSNTSAGQLLQPTTYVHQSPRVRREPTPTASELVPMPVEPEFRTQVSSWANIAGTASPNSRIIDLHPVVKSPYIRPRLRPVGRIPSVQTPHNVESMADQMRVVFLLDLPYTITLENISMAVKEGPLRSIHFGMDEDKKSRYAAVVFQFARDAANFTAALLKERADSKPERFRFIVDVVRGEEPFPLDDILRTMGAPTYASRRLTLVKASFFFMFGERQIRLFCEKLVGEAAIQLIWIYNGGNATIVFADVGSAMIVKAEFDKSAASAGHLDGQPQVWAGLLTTYSKDPCIVPLELKTAMHD